MGRRSWASLRIPIWSGAWSRLERGEIELEDFYAPFEADCRAHGVAVDGIRMMGYIAAQGAASPRPVIQSMPFTAIAVLSIE